MSNKIIGAKLINNVEPVKRMVGGRFGWAVHRFPIKGGVTLAVPWSEALYKSASKQSYFARFLRG